MRLTQRQALRAVIDPSVRTAEWQDVLQHQRNVRLLDKIDRSAERIEELERRRLAGKKIPRAWTATAIHRLDFYRSAAIRAGLIKPEKENAECPNLDSGLRQKIRTQASRPCRSSNS